MKINVKDKSTGATKVAVYIVKPIWNMTDDEMIEALDLKNKVLDYHYSLEQEYKKVDDIYSDEIVEYVAELLYDYCYSSKFDGYKDIAKRLMGKIEDEVVEEIYEFQISSLMMFYRSFSFFLQLAWQFVLYV